MKEQCIAQLQWCSHQTAQRSQLPWPGVYLWPRIKGRAAQRLSAQKRVELSCLTAIDIAKVPAIIYGKECHIQVVSQHARLAKVGIGLETADGQVKGKLLILYVHAFPC